MFAAQEILHVQKNGLQHLAIAFSALVVLSFSGCSTRTIPKPAPTKFCGSGETVGCQPLTPGMKELAPPRGHGDDSNQKMMFYKPPEEIWPEEFKPAPQTCGSPFTGKLITR